METIPHPENRLAGEKSPYLLQHARNPVDWYPWGDEAFARARAEQRPIFLSIGYSTCHWCHVMERESFEDDATAALMNRLFVCIKVDREERPDVDAVYMAYVQATTGGGGWPMSVFLTPDLAPFYGGTYFPVENRYGMPGFRSLLARIGHIWDERRDEVVSQSAKAVGQLRKIAQADARSDGDLTRVDFSGVVDRAAASFARAYDEEHGGFGNAPKFPRPSVHDLLARHAARTGSLDSARMVIDTLRQMARGGIHDHLGGGFARYSVDAEWHVPHFEKMLYDQAQLVASHVDAIKLTTDAATRNELEKTLRAMVGYLRRDLLDPVSGAFFSAEDADSMTPSGERKEGAFYVFSQREIDEALGENAALFSAHYGTTEHGNAHDPHGELTGQNVLHAQRSVADTAARFHLGSDETERRLRDCRAVLLALRDTRPRPRLDDKVLTAWNGQMIGALARAGALLGEAAWVEMSTRAATFITDRLWNAATGTLHRRYRDGEVAIPGYLDDHAFFANGLVDLYEAGFDRRWLTLAETICDRMIARFADEQGGGAGNGFWATDGSDPSVLVRVKDDYDGAEPAGNSVAAIVCQRLGHALDRRDLLDRADGTLRACARRLTEMPHALPEMCLAVDTSLTPPVQIILAGERSDPELGLLLAVANLVPLPGRVLLFADAEARAELGKRLPFLASAVPILVDGRMHAAAYVCHAFACDRPVVTPSDLAAVLARDTKIAFV